MARRFATDARRMPETPMVTVPVTEDDVRRRAFEIYLSRGGGPGSPEDDWTRAERELRGAVIR